MTIGLSKKVFVDKLTLIKERVQRTRQYILKHGYLKMFCSRCKKPFFCSGRCVFRYSVSDIYYTENILGNTCLCEECDDGRTFDTQHYRECGKDDQLKMALQIMAKENKD